MTTKTGTTHESRINKKDEAITGLRKTAENFLTTREQLFTERKAEIKRIHSRYLEDTATDKVAEATQQYSNDLDALKASTKEQADTHVTALREIVTEVVTIPPSEEAVRMVDALRLMAKPSEYDLKQVLDTYGGNYTTARLIADVADTNGFTNTLRQVLGIPDDGQPDTSPRLSLHYALPDASVVIEHIEKAAADLLTVIRSSEDMTYMERLAAKGGNLDRMDTDITAFLDAYPAENGYR
ncbi:MAG: hypothetical protein LBK67_02505 [Coriobacteriales bacterium]|jgi:hypothetical protein|nr:hypothetical protein [Coriobacteriales bacterium]